MRIKSRKGEQDLTTEKLGTNLISDIWFMKNDRAHWIFRILLDITLLLAIIFILSVQTITDSLIAKVLLVVFTLPVKYIIGYFITQAKKEKKEYRVYY